MNRLLSIICLIFIFKIQIQSQPCFRDSIDVLNYSIHLDLSKTATHELWGKTEIKLKAIYELSSIKLDFEGLKTDSIICKKQKLKFSHLGAYLNIVPTRKLKSSDIIEFTVYYHGTPIKDASWGGFFMDRDYAYNYGIGMASNPPNYGRVWFPCIDNFTDRAYYEYYITTAPNNIAACPGLLISEKKLPNGNKEFHWKLNQSIPTYLSSVAVGNYAVVKDTVKGLERVIPIEIFIEKDHEKTVASTFKNLKKFFHAFEYRFGPFKWDKVGYVSTPFTMGAMEHATNIAYGNYCNGSSSCESTFAHELSHHWFGDLVTCSSEKDMWLNEGWASYCEAIYYEYAGGTNAYKEYVRENHRNVLNLAVNNPTAYGAVYGMPHSDTYGSVVYNKGSDVAHTLRGQLGDSLFFSALKQYFKDYAFKNIQVNKFQNYLSALTKTNLNDFFDFWVYSAGFPHFTLQNLEVKNVNNQFQVSFTIDQQLLNTDKYLNSCTIEIGILDKNLKLNKYLIQHHGKSELHKLTLDFEPKLFIIDPDEKISDAVIDEYFIADKSSNYPFRTENLSIEMEKYTSPVFIHGAYHLVSPVAKTIDQKIRAISSKYWEIQCYSQSQYQANAKFYFDSDIIESLVNPNHQNLRLLFRENVNTGWKILDVKPEMNGQQGLFNVDLVKNGEFAIGILN